MRYEITGPDGKVYEIEGPEGATREQVIAAIQARQNEQNRTSEEDAAYVRRARSVLGMSPERISDEEILKKRTEQNWLQRLLGITQEDVIDEAEAREAFRTNFALIPKDIQARLKTMFPAMMSDETWEEMSAKERQAMDERAERHPIASGLGHAASLAAAGPARGTATVVSKIASPIVDAAGNPMVRETVSQIPAQTGRMADVIRESIRGGTFGGTRGDTEDAPMNAAIGAGAGAAAGAVPAAVGAAVQSPAGRQLAGSISRNGLLAYLLAKEFIPN